MEPKETDVKKLIKNVGEKFAHLDHLLEVWDKLIDMKAPIEIMLNHNRITQRNMNILVRDVNTLKDEYGLNMNDEGVEQYNTLCDKMNTLPQSDLDVWFMYIDNNDEETKKYYEDKITDEIEKQALDIVNG